LSSGSTIELRWSVKNIGNGPTIKSQWTDHIYLNSTQPQYLASRRNSEQLFSGDHYRAVMHVTIPKYLSGKFNIFVQTNAGKEEFEYQSYDNNIEGSVS